MFSKHSLTDAIPSASISMQSERLHVAMLKRHSRLRRTISSAEELKEISGMVSVNSEERKNVDRSMHSTNKLYKSLCLLCNENHRYLISHYSKTHPGNECFIARPSPQMVNRIKQQKIDEFRFDKSLKKITGICYFCEEEKTFSKSVWESHLLTHTGEKLYFCGECKTEGAKKGMHKKCDSLYKNIYEEDENNANDSSNNGPITLSKSKNDYPLRCHICKLCNYTQIKE